MANELNHKKYKCRKMVGNQQRNCTKLSDETCYKLHPTKYTQGVKRLDLKIFCHHPRHNIFKTPFKPLIFLFSKMSFSRAPKRPRSSSATERNARVPRKSVTNRVRKPLYEPNTRKKLRNDPVTNKRAKIARKPTIPKTRTKTVRPSVRPVRSAAGGRKKTTKKKNPMPTTMSGMRTESEFLFHGWLTLFICT